MLYRYQPSRWSSRDRSVSLWRLHQYQYNNSCVNPILGEVKECVSDRTRLENSIFFYIGQLRSSFPSLAFSGIQPSRSSTNLVRSLLYGMLGLCRCVGQEFQNAEGRIMEWGDNVSSPSHLRGVQEYSISPTMRPRFITSFTRWCRVQNSIIKRAASILLLFLPMPRYIQYLCLALLLFNPVIQPQCLNPSKRLVNAGIHQQSAKS